MIPTLDFVQKRFDEFNTLVFESSLPPVTIKMSHAKSYLGKLQFRRQRSLFRITPRFTDFVMRFSTMYNLTEAEWEDVILHEMIHYFIASRGVRDTSAHGKIFRRYMADINTRFDRHLRISYKLTPVK